MIRTGMTKNVRSSLLVMIAGMVLLACYYGPLLRSPNAWLFRGSGDGLKNYYAFAYHVKHDSTWMQFGGMNHPFGEQIGFPDAQPALANAVKAMAHVVPCLADRSAAIINLVVLLGMLLTALSVHWILLRLHVPWWYAGLMALGITALSPQVLRMAAGHHALTYGWTITLPILFLMRVVDGARPIRNALIGGAITLTGLYLHPYTGMIATSLLAGALPFLWPWRRRRDLARSLASLVLLAWPIVVFLFVQGITDHHAGRSEKPLGFFDYQTTVTALLMPPGDVRSPLSRLVFPWEGEQVFEGSAYLGLGALLGLLVIAVVWSRARLARVADTEAPHWPALLSALLLSAVLLCLFALGLPFSKEGLTPWDLPFLGQFRSPGRFAWALYYVAGICTAYGLWWASRPGLAGRARALVVVCMAVVPALYLYEARYYHCTACRTIMQDRNVLCADLLTRDERALVHAVDPNAYRAILPVPMFLNGSDEVMLSAEVPVFTTAMLLSQHTGLPMTGYSLARTSVSETREQIGMLTPPWYPRPIGKRYAPDDRFLVLSVGDPANAYEAAVLERASPLGTFGVARLLAITAADLFADRTKELFAHLDTLVGDSIAPGTWGHPAGRKDLVHFPLDDRSAMRAYHGRGAHEAPQKGFNVFATVPAGVLRSGERYIASYWIEHRGTLRSHALTCVAQRDTATGDEEWIVCSDPRFARVVNGDWSLVELAFTAGAATNEYRLFTEGAPFYSDTLLVDEVVVRPAEGESIMVLRRSGEGIEEVLYNGHHLTRPR
jgi:hypothetical protein